MNVIKSLGIGVAAALVVGVLAGALARAFMRLATVVIGGAPGFSWAGTAFIVLIFAITMVPAGLVAALTTHRLRWLAPLAGAVFLCIPAVSTAQADLEDAVGLTTLQWVGVALATVAIFATIALAPVLTVRTVDSWSGRRVRTS